MLLFMYCHVLSYTNELYRKWYNHKTSTYQEEGEICCIEAFEGSGLYRIAPRLTKLQYLD